MQWSMVINITSATWKGYKSIWRLFWMLTYLTCTAVNLPSFWQWKLFLFVFLFLSFCYSCWCCFGLVWWLFLFIYVFSTHWIVTVPLRPQSTFQNVFSLLCTDRQQSQFRIKQWHSSRLVSKSCLGSTTSRCLGIEPAFFLQSLLSGKNVDRTRNRSVNVSSNKVSVVAALEKKNVQGVCFRHVSCPMCHKPVALISAKSS